MDQDVGPAVFLAFLLVFTHFYSPSASFYLDQPFSTTPYLEAKLNVQIEKVATAIAGRENKVWDYSLLINTKVNR